MLRAGSTLGSGIILHFWRQEFQRDVAAQIEVFGFVDHTHRPLPRCNKMRECEMLFQIMAVRTEKFSAPRRALRQR
jgi:hypothetical protein